MSVVAPDPIVPADAPEAATAVPLRFAGPSGKIEAEGHAWADRMGFTGKPGQVVAVPGPDGGPAPASQVWGATFSADGTRAAAADPLLAGRSSRAGPERRVRTRQRGSDTEFGCDGCRCRLSSRR